MFTLYEQTDGGFTPVSEHKTEAAAQKAAAKLTGGWQIEEAVEGGSRIVATSDPVEGA